MLYFLCLLIFASIVFLFLAAGGQGKDKVQERLEQIGFGRKESLSPEEVELSKSLTERIYQPLREKIAKVIGRWTPRGVKENIKKKLLMAGSPRNMQVSDFFTMKGLFTLALPAAFGALLFLGKVPFAQVILCLGITAAFGFFFPDLWINSKIGARQRAVQKALPDVLDLLCVSVEAGLGFDSALSKVVEKTKGPLTEEFAHSLQEIRMSKSRKDALRALSERVGLSDLTSFIAALIQADQLGVSIATVLRIQSEQMRTKRRQRAEEKAQKASLKMLFPLIFFIFPAMFIVLLGPVVLSVLATFKGGGFGK